ncbi:MAG: hypothetical protein INH43_06695 [Acidobacteriaceae bacterium]|nr:hypothetical protein [Acidobacteriaceae bacterium]
MDLRYVFTSPSSANHPGRILQRIEKAETTSAAWGLTWDCDGFGNPWEQRATKGTGPPNTVSFDQTTNRVNAAGYAHDANGNMTAMAGLWGGSLTMWTAGSFPPTAMAAGSKQTRTGIPRSSTISMEWEESESRPTR